MSYRRFVDSQGRVWEAWEVHPSAVERRMNTDRRVARREELDRRRQQEFRLVIPRELRQGWLALQAPTEKLRVSPIPDGWMHLSDDELASLVARAAVQTQATS